MSIESKPADVVVPKLNIICKDDEPTTAAYVFV